MMPINRTSSIKKAQKYRQYNKKINKKKMMKTSLLMI